MNGVNKEKKGREEIWAGRREGKSKWKERREEERKRWGKERKEKSLNISLD